MKPDLEDLKIHLTELERLSGLDISNNFVGGVLGGVYRPTVFRHPLRLLSFLLTELLVGLLIFIFTLPVGLLTIRNTTGTIDQLPVISQFLQITLGTTALVALGWNVAMWVRAKRLTMLMHLLDDLDRYHDVLQAVDLLDQLEAAGNSQINLNNRSEVLEALRMTRDSLVAGLMTEKILRQSRGLLSRRYDLLSSIETNLTSLRSLEIQHHATEYGQVLNQALQIGISVHQEVQKLGV
jgi:hypothetical protein